MEGRRIHLNKAEFIKESLNLSNLTFLHEDVRNFTCKSFGNFDIAICTGILYHLEAESGMQFLNEVCLSSSMVIIDTHIGLNANCEISYNGNSYWGYEYNEPFVDETDTADVLIKNGAAINNRISF